MQDIYQHFRKEERAFIDQVDDWIFQVDQSHAPYLTGFLNPRERYIIESMVGKGQDVHVDFFGGVKGAERQRALLSPSYFEPETSDFQIALMDIHYPSDFKKLSHGQIMGSILGAGLERQVLGDIVNAGEAWQFFIDEKLADFARYNIHQMGRTSVEIRRTGLDEALQTEDDWQTKEVSLSSLRLDAVIKAAFNISRDKAKLLVKGEHVQVNWVTEDRADAPLEISDILSVKGYGRIRLDEHLGQSKKGRQLVSLSTLDSSQKK